MVNNKVDSWINNIKNNDIMNLICILYEVCQRNCERQSIYSSDSETKDQEIQLIVYKISEILRKMIMG